MNYILHKDQFLKNKVARIHSNYGEMSLLWLSDDKVVLNKALPVFIEVLLFSVTQKWFFKFINGDTDIHAPHQLSNSKKKSEAIEMSHSYIGFRCSINSSTQFLFSIRGISGYCFPRFYTVLLNCCYIWTIGHYGVNKFFSRTGTCLQIKPVEGKLNNGLLGKGTVQ